MSSIVDWEDGRWSKINRKGRAKRTLERIAAGRAEHGSRFTISYYGATRGGRNLNRPIGTITTRAKRWERK